MSEFERQLPPCRIAEIHHGDSLQRIAAREMGNANRWPELVWINELKPPYVTDDPDRVAPGVLLSGSVIRVPAPVGVYTDDADRGQVFERDCALVDKLMSVDAGGDIAVFTGADNLRQQLSHVVATPRGQATRHPNYGCMIWRLLGTVTGPLAAYLGADYVKSALASDYRVSRVEYSTAVVSGDVVKVTARAISIEGSIVDIVIDDSGSVEPGPIVPNPENAGYGNNYGNNWGN